MKRYHYGDGTMPEGDYYSASQVDEYRETNVDIIAAGGRALKEAQAELAAKDARIKELEEGNRILRDELSKDQHVMEADAERIAQLWVALRETVDLYTRLINSGDCGNWNPESELQIIAARAALAPRSTEGEG